MLPTGMMSTWDLILLVNLYLIAIYIIWVNYNNSLTWIKAIWGSFPLLTMIPVRSQWGRYNLPRYYVMVTILVMIHAPLDEHLLKLLRRISSRSAGPRNAGCGCLLHYAYWAARVLVPWSGRKIYRTWFLHPNVMNFGKITILTGKSAISMAIFNSYVKLPEGNFPADFL